MWSCEGTSLELLLRAAGAAPFRLASAFPMVESFETANRSYDSQRCHKWCKWRDDGGRRCNVLAGQAVTKVIAGQRHSALVQLGVKWSPMLAIKPDERQHDPCRLSGRHLVTMAEL